MKQKTTILGLVLAALAITACQSNTYKVDGVTEGLEDGDTIFVMTAENSMTTDTIIVKDGKFSFEGPADSVIVKSLVAPKTAAYTMFFIEPGTIHILLSATGLSEVSGTKANDALLEMNKIQYDFQQKGEQLMSQVYTQQLDEEQQKAIYMQYQDLQQQMGQQIADLAKRNVDNELGYLLISQLAYSDLFTKEEINTLIDQMPADFRQREAIQDIQNTSKDLFSTNIGDVIADFHMQTPKGEDASIMSLVSQNKVTVLDFWASWCQPCRDEMPFMKKMLEKLQPQGLGIVGISIDDSKDDWTQAVSELELTWPQMSDLQPQKSPVVMSFAINAIPFTVVVDQNGKILAKELRRESLEEFVEGQLK